MLAKRIIPCLDIDKERVVKGIKFKKLTDAGDPIQLGLDYAEQGADELAFLDISASLKKRKIALSLVRKVAKSLSIPFTVGGGIKTLEDARSVLLAGADKISLNSAAVINPEIISELANIFGSQCIVVAIDAKKVGTNWEVFINGGSTETGIHVLSWAKKVVELGAGEILLTSMDADGTKQGFNVVLTKLVSENVSIPLIASGGAGSMQDFYNVFLEGKADAALAASLFHYKELSIKEVKRYLKEKGVCIRE